MKKALTPGVLIAATLLAGCAGARIQMDSTAAPGMRGSAPPPGTSYSSATVRADVGASPWVGLLFLGIFVAGAADGDRSWGGGSAVRTPPPLAQDRSVAERDCTLPLEAPSANLRCK